MIGAVATQLTGLFVEDGFLAAGILIAVAAIASLILLGALPTWLGGLLLTLLMPAALAASVARSARQAPRPDADEGPPGPP
jgi:hypothetical protein